MRSFPIFVDVESAPPLVFGGGALAAAKARVLLRRSPRVEVAAAELSPAFDDLLKDGRIEPVAELPAIGTIRGRPLVISATEDEATDRRVAAIARSLGVPVNVPDRVDLSTFYLPALVERGEVVLAIGTGGRSPVLAQRLRTWLEQELHPRLGALAALAGEFRKQVNRALPAGPRRRQFWDALLGGPVARAVFAGRDAEARALAHRQLAGEQAAPDRPARVVLVGAGPGDPELLTLMAVRQIKAADVILYDDLVGREILDLARREATLLHVGKRGGRPSMPQQSIHRLIAEHAVPGATIVRLKGGDPFIFGRGGEEIAALRALGIDVDVVPGITSAVAAAAAARVPLTDRRLSRSVTFLSGHGPHSGLPDFTHLDLEALRDGGHTLAVYMAVRTADSLASALLDAGWPGTCPVLAVENVSRPEERQLLATIGDLAQGAAALGLTGPAVLLIGEVAGLAAEDAADVAIRAIPEVLNEREFAYA